MLHSTQYVKVSAIDNKPVAEKDGSIVIYNTENSTKLLAELQQSNPGPYFLGKISLSLESDSNHIKNVTYNYLHYLLSSGEELDNVAKTYFMALDLSKLFEDLKKKASEKVGSVFDSEKSELQLDKNSRYQADFYSCGYSRDTKTVKTVIDFEEANKDKTVLALQEEIVELGNEVKEKQQLLQDALAPYTTNKSEIQKGKFKISSKRSRK